MAWWNRRHYSFSARQKRKTAGYPLNQCRGVNKIEYSRITISSTFWKLPITRIKVVSPLKTTSSPDFSNSPIFQTNFLCLRRFQISGFHCNYVFDECSWIPLLTSICHVSGFTTSLCHGNRVIQCTHSFSAMMSVVNAASWDKTKTKIKQNGKKKKKNTV